MIPIALSKGYVELCIKRLLIAVNEKPTEVEELIEKCADNIYRVFSNKSNDYILVNILAALYDGDYMQMKKDIIKAVFMENSSCDTSTTGLERAIFIKVFIRSRIASEKEDYSILLNEIDRVIECKKDNNLPYV